MYPVLDPKRKQDASARAATEPLVSANRRRDVYVFMIGGGCYDEYHALTSAFQVRYVYAAHLGVILIAVGDRAVLRAGCLPLHLVRPLARRICRGRASFTARQTCLHRVISSPS
jgi:hypothetical protein